MSPNAAPYYASRQLSHPHRTYRPTRHTSAEISPDPQVQLKLSIQRLRTLQEKKLALAKKSRRDIADLLLKNRIETARLRVEGLIQDDIYVELLELLEVSFCFASPCIHIERIMPIWAVAWSAWLQAHQGTLAA